MKKLILVLSLMLIASVSFCQFKIENKLFSTGFENDTAISISIKVVSLDILLESKQQRPVFYLSFENKAGQSIKSSNIDYSDMQQACTKKGIPENQHETIIAQTFMAVYAGTKSQKLASVRGLLDSYGIIVKPDSEQ